MSKNEKSIFRATRPDLSIPIRTKSIIYGASKVGKSPVLAQIPNSYIIDTEKGMRFYKKDVDKNNSVVFESTDVDEIREEILKLQSYKHSYTTLIIDSLSYLYDVCSDKWSHTHKRCLEEDIANISRKRNKNYKDEWVQKKKARDLELNEFGFKYWGNLNGEMRKLQYLLGSKSDIDMNIIVVAYEQITEKEDKKTKFIEKIIRPYLPKKSEYVYDYCIHLSKSDDDKIDPKNKFTPSYASTIGKGDPIPNFLWNIENLKKYILRDSSPAKKKELVDEKTLKYILENRENYISVHQEGKWLAKLDITSWDQLPKDAAIKIVDYIEKKKTNTEEQKKEKEEEMKRLDEEDVDQ
jgi:hypothetical protein